MATRKELNIDKKGEKREKHGFIFLLFAVCAMFIFFIGVSAFSASIQYDINNINKEIQVSERKVQNLQVKLKVSSNITTIEGRAFELGLVYPSFSQVKYLTGEKEIGEFALALKESVF